MCKMRKGQDVPVTRGAFPALIRVPIAAMAKTSEYFGSGGQADRRIIVSQSVTQALSSGNIRGVVVAPVQTAE